MTQDDILRMAREAGLISRHGCRETASDEMLERFASLIAAAEREKLAHWMRSLGYATHGDTIEDLLDHLGTQIAEGLEAEVLMEREACAKVCESMPWISGQTLPSNVEMAAAIRARSKT